MVCGGVFSENFLAKISTLGAMLPELTLLHFIAGVLALYGARVVFVVLRRWWRYLRARHHYKRYREERDAYYGAGGGASAPRHTVHQQSHTHREPEEPIKDRDARVHDMAKPKGFWTRLVMGEKMHIIREMIRISNSDEHKGYWQDRVEAQKRVEGQRQVGEDQGR